MKITRKQLRQIIKEETQRLAEDDYDQQWQDEMSGFHGKEPSANILPADFDDGNPHGDEAEMERGYIDAFEGYPRADDATADYDIGWEQGQKKAADNLERYGPDHTEDDIIHDKGFYEGKKMKITKRQLRRIIKEGLLREGGDPTIAGYVRAIETLGPERFATALVAVLGDVSGYNGHAGILDWIESYR